MYMTLHCIHTHLYDGVVVHGLVFLRLGNLEHERPIWAGLGTRI